MDDIKLLINSEKIDILALTETWLKTGVGKRDFSTEYNIPGYKMYHYDRAYKEGGGVALYVKENFKGSV